MDVGGTLWPDGPHPDERRLRRERLRLIRGDLDEDQLTRLLTALDALAVSWEHDPRCIQAVASLSRILSEQGLADLDPSEVRRAMCVPASPGIALFAGAAKLLRTIKDLGLRCVIVSNTAWRGERDYRADFQAFGVGRYVDDIVTSLDVGYRKPHAAIFERALLVAGAGSEATVMIGDSEERDIAPASARGMRTVLVSNRSSSSVATAVARSPGEAAAVLQVWARFEERGPGAISPA